MLLLKLVLINIYFSEIFHLVYRSLQKITVSSIEKVQSFRKRILKCIQSSTGSFATLRHIQMRLKGSKKDSILRKYLSEE